MVVITFHSLSLVCLFLQGFLLAMPQAVEDFFLGSKYSFHQPKKNKVKGGGGGSSELRITGGIQLRRDISSSPLVPHKK